MSDIRIAAALPRGDANGLGKIAGDLVSEPHRFKVVVMIVDCKKVTKDNDSGETIPTARIRRAEAILPQDLPAAEQLMRRALEDRTGRTVLPLDLEDDMRMAFNDIDPRTGEKHARDDEDGS